ncbi:MAG: cyclase family protein [Thermofilaceae archaeon]
MKIVDLSMELRTGTPVFPGYPIPIVHIWTSIDEHGYYSNLLMLDEHTGTHVDAPAHFVKEAATIDEVPLDRFIGEGVVIDVTDLPPKAVITEESIRKAFKGINVGPGWVVLFRTGYDKKIGDLDWFNHPGLDEKAASYLTALNVNAVGTDAPSIDQQPFPAHKILLAKGIPIYENLTNLAEISGKRFKFYGIPLRIRKGSASPVRPIAVITEPL